MSDELPEGWARARIGDVFDCWGGMTPSTSEAKFWGGSMPWISSKDVNGPVVAGGTECVTERALAENRLRKCPVGSVLVVVRSGVLVHTLPVAVTSREVVVNQDVKALDSGNPEVNAWAALYLRATQRQILEANRKDGTTVQSIRMPELLDHELAVAPLAEQHRIVAKVDSLLEQVRRAKDRLDRVPLILKRFRQAVLAAACEGRLTEEWRAGNPGRQAPARPTTDRVARNRRQGANISKDGDLLIDEMPDLPESWTYWRADEVVDSDTVVTYGIVLPGPEHPGGVPYVRQQDIVDGGILVNELRHTTPAIAAKHARSTLRAGDVLLCIIRNLRVAIVPKGLDGANLTQGAVRLRPGQHVRGDYLAAYLACPAAQGWMKARYFGMDMPRINVEDARAIPIALPPIDEQAEIMRRVDALFRLEEKVRGRLAACINRAGALPQAILSKAFAGELVPTEADLARAENRDYETAEHALDRLRREVEGGVSRRPANKARGTRTD